MVGGSFLPTPLMNNDYPSPYGHSKCPNAVYPCFIGISQTSNQIADVIRPYESIPRGSFFSVLTSMVL